MTQKSFKTDNVVQELAAKTTLHSGVVILAYTLTWWVIIPIQSHFLASMATIATVMYLPFGVKLISAFFEGWRSIVFMGPGVVMANVIFIQLPFSSVLTYIALFVSYATAPAIFFVLDWAARYDRRELCAARAWRTLILAGGISSILIPVLIHVIYHDVIPQDEFILSLFRFMVGDMTGLLTVLAILALTFRILRIKASSPSLP